MPQVVGQVVDKTEFCLRSKEKPKMAASTHSCKQFQSTEKKNSKESQSIHMYQK